MISLFIILLKKQKGKEPNERIYWIFILEAAIESWIFVFIAAYYFYLLGKEMAKIIF